MAAIPSNAGAKLLTQRSQAAKAGSQAESDSRFKRRLNEILNHAAIVFCEKGYQGSSMRDLSRATGMSLAGMYHYFESKEKLLYLIQKHTFQTILEGLRTKLAMEEDAERRVRTFIQNHLEYFLEHKQAMKVLSHEDAVLKNGYGTEVLALKREYYRICTELLEDLRSSEGLEFNSRIAVLSLFGMINWIYTWHNPRVDADAKALAQQMGDLFLRGLTGLPATENKKTRSRSQI